MNFPSSAHHDMLIQAQRHLNQVAPLIQKAKDCGIDCSAYEQGWHHISSQASKRLAVFFPGQVVAPNPSGIPAVE